MSGKGVNQGSVSPHLQLLARKRTLGVREVFLRQNRGEIGSGIGVPEGGNREVENSVFQKSPIFERPNRAVRFLSATTTNGNLEFRVLSVERSKLSTLHSALRPLCANTRGFCREIFDRYQGSG